MDYIVDLKDRILGKASSIIAKELLKGNKVYVVNCRYSIISGNPKVILERYKTKKDIGDPHHGPYFPRTPNGIVRRTIRGMLPFKKAKGKNAYKLLRCFDEFPEEIKEETKDFKKLEIKFGLENLNSMKYLRLYDVAKQLGYKK